MKEKLAEFELVPRGSDIHLKVRGATLQALFRNVVKGIAAYIHPGVSAGHAIRTQGKHPINVEAVDINSLLVEFATWVISRSDMENMVFTDAVFETLGENFLEGTLLGEGSDTPERMIQNVSYQDVDIKRNPESGFYEAVLVCEVG